MNISYQCQRLEEISELQVHCFSVFDVDFDQVSGHKAIGFGQLR